MIPKAVFSIIAALGLLAAAPTLAANHALLIGISRYDHLQYHRQLAGPVNDVAVMRMVLKRHWGMPEGNIRVLVDGQASRQGILGALARLETDTRPGDFIFLYFSGHGTSAHDLNSHNVVMDPFTGALVPSDFAHGSPEEMRRRLIIGRRDLRPVLERLDRDRRILAVFDACYSGNAVRSLDKFRFIALGGRPEKNPGQFRSSSANWEPGEDLTDGQGIAYGSATSEVPAYPYDHLVFLSAASMRETAADVNPAVSPGGKTVTTLDGLPHGAMSDYLLRGLSGQADTNGDGSVTVLELFNYTRGQVAPRYPQTPGLLYNPDGGRLLLDAPLFDRPIAHPVRQTQRVAGGGLRLRMDGVGPSMRQRLLSLDGVRVVTGDYDLMICQDNGKVWMNLPGGHFLAALPAGDPGPIVQRIVRRVKVEELLALADGQKPFNVFLSLIGVGGVLAGGDTLGFEIHSEADGYPLLMDVDPAGKIHVIYPLNKSEIRRQPAGETLSLPDMGVVEKPFGTENLLVFWFRQPPPEMARIAGGEFTPADPLVDRLLDMVRSAGSNAAAARMQVKSFAGHGQSTHPGRPAAGGKAAGRAYYEQAQAAADPIRRLELLERSVAAHRDFSAYFELAAIYWKAERLADARVAGREALNLAATARAEAFALARLGQVCGAMGDENDAVICLRRSYAQHPLPNVRDKLKQIETARMNRGMPAAYIVRSLSSWETRELSAVGQRNFGPPSLDIRIGFAFDSAHLNDAGHRQAEELGRALTDPALAGRRFLLVGHTDRIGSDAYNLELSRRRAETVKRYLADTWNLPAHGIQTDGKGKRQLLYPGGSEREHALNRRVEILMTGQ